MDKFALLAHLGVVTVPDDYVHDRQLAVFRKKHRKKFWHHSSDITDRNFPNPSRILKPGDRLHVRAFEQVVPGVTTSEEHMAFLAGEDAIYAGAQGITVVFDQKRDQLPKGRWYASFDEKSRLWENGGDYHGVPCLVALVRGGFDLDLAAFGHGWDVTCSFLCFCDDSG